MLLTVISGLNVASAQNFFGPERPAERDHAPRAERMMDRMENGEGAMQRMKKGPQRLTEEERAERQADPQVQAMAKEKLELFVSHTIETMELHKAHVEANERMTDEEKTEILERLSEDITYLTEKQTTVLAASGEEIWDVAKEVKEHLHANKKAMRKEVGKRLGGHADKARGHMNRMGEKLDAKVEELQEAGKDTTDLEAAIAEMNTQKEAMKETMEAAKALFESAAESDAPKAVVEEARAMVKDAHETMKPAMEAVREAMKALRDEE